MEESLTKSQVVALDNLINWYHGNRSFAILHGAAGYGKTYLLNIFLAKLGNTVKPLLLADTNEATNVLRQITNGGYQATTICSALGLALSAEGAKQVLVKRTEPDLSDYNLIIVDECSMLDTDKLKYLEDTGKYVLYSGHVSQLPPVIENLSVDDNCISPVFEQDYPLFNLTDPVRNTGEIFEFCQEAEKLIYKRGVLPYKFKESKEYVRKYLHDNRDLVFNNETVFLAYSNKRVEQLNHSARLAIFKKKSADLELFYPEDKVIFRSPTLVFNMPVKLGTTKLEQIVRKGISHNQAATNSRGVVRAVKTKTILGVLCHELFVEVNTFEKKFSGYVYVALDLVAKEELRKKMYVTALYDHNKVTAQKKWEAYHNLSLVLSNTKHSYAMTVHCSQGSTIQNVFIDESDIDKCNNSVLRRKLKYVAFSRAAKNLYRI